MSEFETKEIKELATLSYGYTASSSSKRIGPHLLRITDIASGTVNWDSVPFCEISEKDFAKHKIQSGDTFIARTGASTGTNFTVKEPPQAVNASYLIRVRWNQNHVNSFFAGYALRTPQWNGYVEGIMGGSAQPNANATQFGQYLIPCPPLREQEAIAEVLSSLDDKIDVLKRQNKTLEGMAEALFRQWFIEEAQDDWEEVEMGELVDVVGGATPNTSNPDFWDGDVAWTSPRDATQYEGLFLLRTDKTITKSGLGKVSSGVLPRGTLLMTSRAPVGRVVIADLPLAINQGYIAFSDIRFVTKSWLFFWLNHHNDLVLSFANGSTFLEVSKRAFRKIPVIKPDQETTLAFDSFARDNLSRILSNEREIRLLQKKRDTLLPKLMSGEVRVNLD